jgi:hypothetical protein
VLRVPTRSPLITPWEIALLDSKNVEDLADNLETQFQPVTDPSVPAVMEKVNVRLRSYFMAPTREPKLTNPKEEQEAIKGLSVGKTPGEKGIPKMALKYLPQRVVAHLVLIPPSPITSLYTLTGEGSRTAKIISALSPPGHDC